MIHSKDNPLRPPDWRWLRAQWLRNSGKYAKKSREDAETLLIKRYLTSKNACHNEMQLERLMYKMPGLYHAEQFYGREDLDIRWEVEARLLAREPIESIANKLGVETEVIFWYERAFYNVIEKLDNRSYISNVAMGRSIHRGLYERDYDLLWKMLGYACGPLMVDSLTCKLGMPQRVDAADQVDPTKKTLTGSVLAEKALYAAITMPLSYNHGIILDNYVKMLEIEKNAGKGGDRKSVV